MIPKNKKKLIVYTKRRLFYHCYIIPFICICTDFVLNKMKIKIYVYQTNCFSCICFFPIVNGFFCVDLSSPEPEAQLIFFGQNLSVVCQCCFVINFSLIIFFSKTTRPFSTRLSTNHPKGKGLQVYSNEGPCLLWGGYNLELLKFFLYF